MKALAVFSGGLDSMLASTIIRTQGIEVLALFFETPFFSSRRAIKSANSINLPIKVIDITKPFLKLLKNPRYGYGSHMNPCIDCHAFMIRNAGDMLEREGASFIITGEVLGQRPMSQNRKALAIVSKESGYDGLVLRPLSARLLPETIPEKRGWVDRSALYRLSGRSRKPQMRLAEEFNIKDYPSPAGGCLLTDEVFSKRLKDLLKYTPDPEISMMELLKVGRHFRTPSGCKIIIGRNKHENKTIEELGGPDDLLIKTQMVPGPTVLLSGKPQREDIELASRMAVSYSDAEDGIPMDVRIYDGKKEEVLKAEGIPKERFRELMV